MANLKTGLSPINKQGGYNAGNLRAYACGNNTAAALYAGQLVQLTSGLIAPGGANGGNIGVVVGFLWIDNTTKQPVMDRYLPAGTTSGGTIDGFDSPIALVIDDPDQIYTIEADAAVNANAVGQYFTLTSFTAGSSFTKRSTAQLDADSNTTTTEDKVVKLVGFHKLPGWDRTLCEVKVIAPDTKINQVVTP